jgi:hypothetical protein
MLKEQATEVAALVTAAFDQKFNQFAAELTAKVEGRLQTQERRHQDQVQAIRADFTNQLNALKARQEQSERAAVANNVVIIGVPEGDDQQQLARLLPANASKDRVPAPRACEPGCGQAPASPRKVFITDDLTQAQRDSRTARRAEFQQY